MTLSAAQSYPESNRSDAAEAPVTIPGLFNFWLTGNLGAEYTNATTTWFMNAKTRTWATDIFEDLSLPSRLLPQIFEPGTIIGASNGTPVVTPACHDTWSLPGTEVYEPVMTPRALELNFTNEGGVCGTTRLLRNIAGLWLLQTCRRCWLERGHEYSYEELLAAAEPAHATSIIDPDHPSFLNPTNMIDAIADYCRNTAQPIPATPGAYTRTILESLALKYSKLLESLEELIGYRLAEVHIIGGGSKNHLLNQLTANATGRPVVAGPVEATALGNIAMQMVATQKMSLAAARDIIDRSFPTTRYEPQC